MNGLLLSTATENKDIKFSSKNMKNLDESEKVKKGDFFEDLIKNANFRYIFLSYNNEGLMPPSQVRKIMEKYGHYDLTHTPYQRFKADKNENRKHKADSTVEYLHILEKR